VLLKVTSVFKLVAAIPAIFKKVASIPVAPATFTEAHPAERAKGLIKSSEAPAEPARCGLPAVATLKVATVKTIERYDFNFIIVLLLE
jgi:hypothetical protein